MQRSSRLIALASIVLPAVAGFSSAAHADPPIKIAVVDMQRAMNETEDGRKAKSNLKRLFEDRQKQLDKQQNDLKTMKESLEKQRDVLSRDVLAKKLEEYQKAFGELQTTYMEMQRELQSKEGELTKDIIERMQRIMRRVGQTDGYTLVLERNESGVVFVPSNYDLTDVLIQRYNAGEGKGEGGPTETVKAAPKPPAAPKPK
jgi:outer membrane protein